MIEQDQVRVAEDRGQRVVQIMADLEHVAAKRCLVLDLRVSFSRRFELGNRLLAPKDLLGHDENNFRPLRGFWHYRNICLTRSMPVQVRHENCQLAGMPRRFKDRVQCFWRYSSDHSKVESSGVDFAGKLAA